MCEENKNESEISGFRKRLNELRRNRILMWEIAQKNYEEYMKTRSGSEVDKLHIMIPTTKP